MAIIYSYPLNDDIKPLDELVGTTEKNINGQLKTVTRNFLLQDLVEFFIVDGGLQKAITLTTNNSTGAATLDQITGILNIPQYDLNKVTSVSGVGLITSTGGLSPVISTSLSANKLVGRYSTSTGIFEEITLGTGLSFFGNILNATSAVTPYALTRTNDTNVTLTLGGSPNAALLSGVSLTLGWAGTLADSRIASAANWNGKENALPTVPVSGYVLSSTTAGVRSWVAQTGGGGSSPLTTKGDLYTFSTVGTRLPVGANGQILTANSSVPEGLSWQDNYADWTSVVKHTVKNNGLSGTITKGTAVYVTSSNGTNILVGRASNVSEPTSSKTMGLMQSDITTTGGTQTGFVITEGLLGGLDTAGTTAGDPVWLGVDGALIYGLINKPFAPNHLVFIGIVTKVSAGNGEIFVKVQNGFELKELHDVQAQSPTLKDTLWYDNTVTPAQWKTASIQTILGVPVLSGSNTGDQSVNTLTNALISSLFNNDVLQYESSTNLWKNKAILIGDTDFASDNNTYNSTLLQTLFALKQSILVSTVNIKSINGSSVLGSGNLVISPVIDDLDYLLVTSFRTLYNY